MTLQDFEDKRLERVEHEQEGVLRLYFQGGSTLEIANGVHGALVLTAEYRVVEPHMKRERLSRQAAAKREGVG